MARATARLFHVLTNDAAYLPNQSISSCITCRMHCIDFFRITRPGRGRTDPATPNELGSETKVEFVNETITTVSGLCADSTASKSKPERETKLERTEKQRSSSPEHQAASTSAVIVKRTRGRPKKQTCISHAAATVQTTEADDKRNATDKVAEKRKRGRPRRQPKSPSVTALHHISTGQITGKRKRGRPRKHNIELPDPRIMNHTESQGNSSFATVPPHGIRYPARNRQPAGAAGVGSQCNAEDYCEILDSSTSDYSSDEAYDIFNADSQSETEEEMVLLSNTSQGISRGSNRVKGGKRVKV
jgi:hypothetical protein